MAELPGYDEALGVVLGAVAALPGEAVALTQVAGRVLLEAVTADRDQPPFDRSAMDGFAVASAGYVAGRAFTIVGSVPAGGRWDGSVAVGEGDVLRIATGAAVPEGIGLDAVIPIERAAVDEAAGTVVFDVPTVQAGASVHRRGSDAQAGGVVIPAGTWLGPNHLGIAAAVGQTRLQVARRPRVAVLTSGDEVKPPATPTSDLAAQQIRNSNGPMLAALVQAIGAELVSITHVVDEADAVRSACEAAARSADVVVTAGGVSVGQRDLFPTTWGAIGFETVLHGVGIQPGKPLLVARSGACDDSAAIYDRPLNGAVVVGLPGNPVSVLATAHLFLWPMLLKMMGLGGGLPWRRVWLAEPVKPNARRQAFRVVSFVGETREQVRVVGWKGSGDLVHTAGGAGWVRLPVSGEQVPPGTGLEFLPMLGSVGFESGVRP